jgi:hypothetical protein
MIKPIPINTPPTKNNGVMLSPRNSQPRNVPTTGCAKNVSDAIPASTRVKADVAGHGDPLFSGDAHQVDIAQVSGW